MRSILLLLLAGCADVEDHDHDHDHDHNHGLVTSVVLHFIPANGDPTLSYEWADPEGDGDPVIDEIIVPDRTDHAHHDAKRYTLSVEVWNELEDPVEDVTLEIAELAEEHQLFFTGSAVEGPATGENPDAILSHTYGDVDAEGLPLGLENEITTKAWGEGELTVTLRHLPPEGGEPVKVAGMAEVVAEEGFGAIGGDNDIQVTFNVIVE